MKRSRPDSAQDQRRVTRPRSNGSQSSTSSGPSNATADSPQQISATINTAAQQLELAKQQAQQAQAQHQVHALAAQARAHPDSTNLALLSAVQVSHGPHTSVQPAELHSANSAQLAASYVMPPHSGHPHSHHPHQPHPYGHIHPIQSQMANPQPGPPPASSLQILSRFSNEVNALAKDVNDRAFGSPVGGSSSVSGLGSTSHLHMIEDDPPGAGLGIPEEGSAKKRAKSAPRTNRACLHCRRQKMRCEGADDPPCKRCRGAGVECQFERRADYLLNPEDSAWHNRVNAQLETLSSAVIDLYRVLGHSPPPGLAREIAGQLPSTQTAGANGGGSNLDRNPSRSGDPSTSRQLSSMRSTSGTSASSAAYSTSQPHQQPSSSAQVFASPGRITATAPTQSLSSQYEALQQQLSSGSPSQLAAQAYGGTAPTSLPQNSSHYIAQPTATAMSLRTDGSSSTFDVAQMFENDAVFKTLDMLQRGATNHSSVQDSKGADNRRGSAGLMKGDTSPEDQAARMKAADAASRPSSGMGSIPGGGIGVGSNESSQIPSGATSREGSIPPHGQTKTIHQHTPHDELLSM